MCPGYCARSGSRAPWWAAVAAWALWTVAVVGLAVSMMVIDRLLQRVGDTFFTNFATAPLLVCVSAATVGAAVDPTSTLLLGLSPMAG